MTEIMNPDPGDYYPDKWGQFHKRLNRSTPDLPPSSNDSGVNLTDREEILTPDQLSESNAALARMATLRTQGPLEGDTTVVG
jgi:hypothetical protein